MSPRKNSPDWELGNIVRESQIPGKKMLVVLSKIIKQNWIREKLGDNTDNRYHTPNGRKLNDIFGS